MSMLNSILFNLPPRELISNWESQVLGKVSVEQIGGGSYLPLC